MNPSRVAAALLLGAALAAQDAAKIVQEQFARFDENKDGTLARTEFPGSDRQFQAIDADKDGKLTLAEYRDSDTGKRLVAARFADRNEPRPRITLAQLAVDRLTTAMQCDRNRDGRVTLAEWTGTPGAFAELDLDHNEMLDRRDLAEARAAAPSPEPELEWSGDVPDLELVLRLDKDKDERISRKEAAAVKALEAAFEIADTDRNGHLDREELARLLVQARELQAREQDKRPRAYDVPFHDWDKDKDGKIAQNEWQGNRSLFERIDLDGDAAVNPDELARYKRRVEGNTFLERYDQNGDGRVTAAEFGGPLDAFRRVDRNGDGVITRSDQ